VRRIPDWIADLDSDDFAVREKATTELERLAELAAPALRRALEGNPPAEVRRRAEALLEKVQEPASSVVWLRALRAVEALEYAATPDSRRFLEALAKGVPDARLTREAKAAAERLARRPADAP
jgi:hypothetical protein